MRASRAKVKADRCADRSHSDGVRDGRARSENQSNSERYRSFSPAPWPYPNGIGAKVQME
jgi:hypothetical protein